MIYLQHLHAPLFINQPSLNLKSENMVCTFRECMVNGTELSPQRKSLTRETTMMVPWISISRGAIGSTHVDVACL